MRLLRVHFREIIWAVYCLLFNVGIISWLDVVLNSRKVCEDVVLDVEFGFVHFMEVTLEFAVRHVVHFWPFKSSR